MTDGLGMDGSVVMLPYRTRAVKALLNQLDDGTVHEVYIRKVRENPLYVAVR